MTESFPRVSVITAVYNTDKYLAKCIESVLHQTYSNVEHILVNDGSTDGSLAIMEKFQEENPGRIKVISKENGGQAAARNMALLLVTGEYLAFLDSDDYLSEDYVETLVKEAMKTEGGADMVASGQYKVGEDGSIKDTISYKVKDGVSYRRRLNIAGKLYKKEYVNRFGISFPEGRLYEDNSFNMLAFFLSDKVRILPYHGYNQVVHEGSTTARKIEADSLPWENWEYCIKTVREQQAKGCGSDSELFDFTMLSFFTYFLMVRNRKREYLSDDNRREEMENTYLIAERFEGLVQKYFPDSRRNRYLSLFKYRDLPLMQKAGTRVFVRYCLKGKLKKLVKVVYSL